MIEDVDLIFLSRGPTPPRDDVRRGVESQAGVRLILHRVFGTARAGDANRWETIARARNEAKRLGSARWVLCLDDDVVLGPGCVARLVAGLKARPGFAALAADSAGEVDPSTGWWDHPPHVGMAAVLFRRERLAGLTFRWEPEKCECRCCCDDLRRAGHGIGYLPGASAWHRPSPPRKPEGPAAAPVVAGAVVPSRPLPSGSPPGRILAAFDRRDLLGFRRLFLRSLRASGNREPVTAVAYGLYPSERMALAREPGVEVVAIPADDVCPAIRRLRDFQAVVARWPAETPVAYWDAGDVIFQGPIARLWDLVREHPEKLLVVRDTLGYDESPVIVPWTNTILDPTWRKRAFELLSTHTFLNSGFATGTARALMGYLREGDRLMGSALKGLGPWGDQVALNVYCHTHPEAWREISGTWNYCLACRWPDEFRQRPDGVFEGTDGRPVHVVHGNAKTLREKTLPAMT